MANNAYGFVFVALVVGVLIGYGVAFSSSDPIVDNYPVVLAAAGDHSHEQLNVSASQAPSVDLIIREDMMGGYNIELNTTGFEFTPQNFGSEHVSGEGHAHLYVDDVKLSRIYSQYSYLPKLTSGEHEVFVTLSTNNHMEYAVDGQTIIDRETIIVE